MKTTYLLYALVTAALMPGLASAQTRAAESYPNKPIRLIVPFAPGGGTDIIARLLARELTGYLGQSVIVDNRGGAGGVVGTELGVRALPDGYTLTLNSGSYSTSAALIDLPYDPIKDITPVILVGDTLFLAIVHPSVQANNVKELIALAKAKPGGFSYGSTGTGGITHLAMELFNMMAGTQMVQVPYKGTAPALNDIIGGQIPLMLSTAPSALPHVRSKRLRAIAVTSAKRSASLPDIPTVAESGLPGYEAVSWYAVFGPKGLPRPIVARLNAEFSKAMALPDIQSKFALEGIEVRGGEPRVFEALLTREIAKWKEVVKQAKLKPTS